MYNYHGRGLDKLFESGASPALVMLRSWRHRWLQPLDGLYDQLFEKYLYQDLPELLKLDAQNLGQRIVTAEEELEEIVKKIDKADQRRLRAIQAASRDSAVLNNNDKAKELLDGIKKLVNDKNVIDRMSHNELKLLEKESMGHVCKGYGTNCEEAALDRYEAQTGFKVTERNSKVYKMKILHLNSKSNSNNSTEVNNDGNTSKSNNGDDDRRDTHGLKNHTDNSDAQQTVELGASPSLPSVPVASIAAVSTIDSTGYSTADSTAKKVYANSPSQCSQGISLSGSVCSDENDQNPENTTESSDTRRDGQYSGSPNTMKDQLLNGEVSTKSNNSTSVVTITTAASSQSAHTNTAATQQKNAFATMMQASKKLSQKPGGAALASQSSKRRRRGNAADINKSTVSFLLVGKVDGISDQLDTTHDDAYQWESIRVVVEMKSRVRRIANPPPLYEQIQLVAYMLMLGCRHGDLVQSVSLRGDRNDRKDRKDRRSKREQPIQQLVASSAGAMATSQLQHTVGSGEVTVHSHTDTNIMMVTSDNSSSNNNNNSVLVNNSNNSNSNNKNSGEPIPAVDNTTADGEINDGIESFLISRIELNSEPYHHQKQWDEVVLPRLRMFRDAVHSMRDDDGLRYRYLLSDPSEKLGIIAELCPFLDLNCISASSRGGN